MTPRPRDYYGPDDWDGTTDPADDDAAVRAKQSKWDAEFAKLPWWKRLVYDLFYYGV